MTDMYHNPKIAADFAAAEQNDKHRAVSHIVDLVALHELSSASAPLHIAELGAGAHPDRYDGLFARLSADPVGQIDWVDDSPVMLQLAQKYLDEAGLSARRSVMRFVQQDMLDYLEAATDNSLDLVILKYMSAHLSPSDFERLVKLVSMKLKTNGRLVATVPYSSPVQRSHSTSAAYFLNGEAIPAGETRALKHGDGVTFKFFRISGQPDAGFLEGAETVQYYHDPSWVKEVAQENNLGCFIGDWSERVPENERGGEIAGQAVMVLKK